MGESARKDDMLVTLTVEQLRSLIREEVRGELGNTNASSTYMTVDQVAELLQVNARTVRNWVRSEGLPAMRVGAEYRFRRENVVTWLEDRATKPGAHTTKHVKRLQRAK
jgi:excisionase family DNA binding protein